MMTVTPNIDAIHIQNTIVILNWIMPYFAKGITPIGAGESLYTPKSVRIYTSVSMIIITIKSLS